MIKQVLVETEKQFNFVLSREDVKDIILSVDSFSDTEIAKLAKVITNSGKNAFLRLERITRKDMPALNAYDKFLNDDNIKGFLIENIDSFNRLITSISKLSMSTAPSIIAPKTDKLIELDYTMNIWNEDARATYDSLAEKNLQYTYPIELSAYDMLKLHMSTLVVYSDLPVMVSANCIEKTEGRCEGRCESYAEGCCNDRADARCEGRADGRENNIKKGYLIDRKNSRVPYKTYCKYCYNKIFNPDHYYIADILNKDDNLKKLKYKKVRFEFSLIEDEKKISKILDMKAMDEKDNFTRGHIKKSIE